MSDSKLSALPAAGSITGTELVYIVQSGASVQTNVNDLATFITTGGFTFTNGLTESGGAVKLGGAITANTTISGAFSIAFMSNSNFEVDCDNIILQDVGNNNNFSISTNGPKMHSTGFFDFTLDIGANKALLTDNRTTKSGLEYNADYSAGYTTRSLVDKGFLLSQKGVIYNVLNYGLIGDATTDNSTAFNTLLNTTAPTGSVIYFPAGQYNFGSTITVVDKQFSLVSDFAILFNTFNGEILNISSTVNFTQSGSKWNFDKLIFSATNSGASQAALYFSTNSSTFVINNCRFNNYSDSCVKIESTNSAFAGQGGQIVNCRFYSANIGVNCLNLGEYILINNCDFLECTTGIKSIAGNLLIDGNNISRNLTGIQFLNGGNNGHSIVTSNNINHNSTYALDIQNTPYGMTFSDNHIYASDINIVTCSGISFIGGTQDVGTYIFDTTIGTTFNGVIFGGTSGIQTITGAAPIYNNCFKVDGDIAANPNTFISGPSSYTSGMAYVNGFKNVDGTQAAGYVLTSDAAGVGTWQPGGGVSLPSTQIGYGTGGGVTSNSGFTFDPTLSSGNESLLIIQNVSPQFQLIGSGGNVKQEISGGDYYTTSTGNIIFRPAGSETVRFTTGAVLIASGQALQLGNAATTALTPGVLAATTNASIVITDSAGQAYRIPCII